MKLQHVVLPLHDGGRGRWDLEVSDGVLQSIRLAATPADADADADAAAATPPSVLLPPLCHPHIHLDKAYLLTGHPRPADGEHPDYADLAPSSGSFAEALANTARAKERYTSADLYRRGAQLLATSCRQGVTALRAFVEVDNVTGTAPLAAAARLRREFAHLLDMQICVFAQDPLFSTAHGDANRAVLAAALAEHGADVDALGATPYVEKAPADAQRNIDWAVATALDHGLHLDFHLDYNLSAATPLTWSVVAALQRHDWLGRAAPGRTIVLGHCTQLSTLGDGALRRLADEVRASRLPIHFVGLPTSDLFMMGRPGSGDETAYGARPRGTLPALHLIDDLGLAACLGVNNVGNAFTPYGTGDPLQLACWGVGLYQAGTAAAAATLYGCVSWRARQAIGLEETGRVPAWRAGDRWEPMLRLENEDAIALPGRPGETELKVPARHRLSVQDVVWDPPEPRLRSILR